MDKKGSLFDGIEGVVQTFMLVFIIIAVIVTINIIVDANIFTSGESADIINTLDTQVKPTFDYFTLSIFFGWMIGTILLAFSLRTNPAFLAINFVVLFAGTALSAVLSNAYETFKDGAVGELLTAINVIPKTNLLMQNLPIFFAFWGIVFLFVLFFIKPTEEETVGGI